MSVVSAALDLLYPRRCAACGRSPGGEFGAICWDCVRRFPVISDPYCRRCGDPVEGAILHEYDCSICRREEPPFELARSAVRYRGPVRRALHVFKYAGATCLATDLASFLLACIEAHVPQWGLDAVTCVPLYAKRQRERSYNQSELLARRVARSLRLPCVPNCLARVRETATQTGLHAGQRRANVRGAFAARHQAWVHGRSLLLIDDVMTTGATVSECSRVLKGAGAAGVSVVTVARG